MYHVGKGDNSLQAAIRNTRQIVTGQVANACSAELTFGTIGIVRVCSLFYCYELSLVMNRRLLPMVACYELSPVTNCRLTILGDI